MKKQLLFLGIAILALGLNLGKAQIISTSYDAMETWNPDAISSSVNDPNSGTLNTPGWQCLNMFTFSLLGGSPQSVFEENTIVHGGSHSCKIVSVVLNSTSYNYIKAAYKHDTLGALLTATITSTPAIVPGAPFTSRTAAINFYYQYFPQNNNAKPDTASCAVLLTKNHVTIGGGYLSMNAASSWTLGTANIFYSAPGNPDTIIVVFSSSSAYKPAPGSILYIDDISAAAPSDVNSVNGASANVMVYPNPASSQINFRISGETAKYVKCYDITGKEINSYTIANNALSVNTSNYASGLYIYQVYNENGALLKVGKFNVER